MTTRRRPSGRRRARSFLTLRDRLVIEDPAGNEVAAVHRHLVALRPTYGVTIGGEKAVEVRRNLFTPFRERFAIDIPGPDDLEISGDLFDHESTVERDGQQVAAVSKRWLSLRDTYGVDIAEGQNHLLILASVLALDLAMARKADKDEDKPHSAAMDQTLSLRGRCQQRTSTAAQNDGPRPRRGW